MSKPQDGLVSRFLNRPISGLVTRVLLKFPTHPNTWTIAMLILPLGACLFLIRGDYVGIVAGAAIFQLYSILDGCDGEIARAKNLQSKFGERLDSFCDSVAGILFVVALAFGIHRVAEGIVCSILIAAHEWLLRIEPSESSAELGQSFYQRHHRMIAHSGLLRLGDNFVWWIFQLTKRDVGIFVFLVLALIGQANWILHLWLTVAGVSVILDGIALSRVGARRNRIAVTRT